jgi:putative ABC transport system substrate-binding protein
MRRREFMAGLAGAMLSPPVVAGAQEAERTRLVGALMNLSENDDESRLYVSAFVDGMRLAGWVEGRNVQFDFRWAAGSPERYVKFAAELVARSPDVILASNSSIVRTLQQRTRTIPIVFAGGTDPVGGGVVASLSHPGGNVTGFSSFEYAMTGKWVELLKEVAPALARAAVLYNGNAVASVGQLRAIEAAAASMKMDIRRIDIRTAADIERGLVGFAREPHGGLITVSNAMVSEHRDEIIALTARLRLPAIYPFRYFARSGGLITYGPDRLEPYRRAAGYVGRILKGEKPANLPVEEPTTYELAINLRTARALGLEIPPTLLARADEVIE